MAKGKMKMLHLMRIFTEETDDEHPLTLQEIIGMLAAVNISADRKTLYDDFEELRQFGFDIIAEQRNRTTYYHLGARDFELPELKLLVDSVQAAKFITTRKSRELIQKLEKNVSRHQAAQLHFFIQIPLCVMKTNLAAGVDGFMQLIDVVVDGFIHRLHPPGDIHLTMASIKPLSASVARLRAGR